MKRKFILSVLSSFVYLAAHAGFTPVTVTGFNEDIVANGSLGVAPSISANLPTGFDSGGYALVSQDYVDSDGNSPSYYLPTSGSVNSILTQGLTFQLADYSSNNALYLSNAGTSGTLTLATAQSAGTVYLVGTSASASVFDVIVNFSDNTSQTFSGNEFFDWQQSAGTASVTGIGRVATATGLTDGTSTNPHLFELKLAINVSNAAKLITSITINKINSATHLAIMGVTLQDFCSGTPVTGAIASTQGIGCNFYSPTVSTTGDTTLAGLTYQWQSSTDGITYSNVFGATNHTYVASVSANIYYRDSITCLASNLSAYSPDTELIYSAVTPTLATLPYFQSFENWMGSCYLHDRPDSSWTLNPTSGNYSWRRDDQGADASWDGATLGAYSPVFSDGSHSARFHTYFHVTGLTEGDMDLHIDLSAPGTKEIVFDYLNQTGTGYLDGNYLKVELSEDGGTTFPTTLATITAYGGWMQEILTTTSTASNAVIRFAGFRGDGDNDLGVDSVYVGVLPSCTGAPDAGTFTATQTESCIPYTSILSVDAPIYQTGISYQWQSSIDGGTSYSDVVGATDVNYTANVTATTYYRFKVTCSVSEQTSTSAAIDLQLNTPQTGVATLPYFQSFENWTGNCSPVYRPDSNWANDSTTGNDSWRRDDQGADAYWTNANGVPDATDGGYSPASTDGDHSARFHNYAFTTVGAAPTTTGALDLHVDLSPVGTKTISFDCISTSGDDLTVSLSEDGGTTFTSLGAASNTLTWAQQVFTTNSVSANAVIRIIGHNSTIYDLFGAGINEDIGIDSFAVYVAPDCAGMPTAGTFSNTQTFGCVPYTSTLTVDAVNAASGIVYQWQKSTDGGVTFTDVPGATAPLYNANITDSVYYRFYVVCTNSNDTDTSPATQFILTPQPVDTATLPYFQGFENWSGICYTYGRPDSNWSNMPAYGDASWRRNDQGDDAGWQDVIGGAYGNASTEGNFSARFHSNAASLQEGDLDIHLNLNQPGLKNITFDYNLWNSTPGTNSGNMLIVELSEDGGVTFDTLATYIGNELGWTSELLTTTSVSTSAVLRFAGIGAYTAFPEANLGPDIGLDSLNVGLAPLCDTLDGVAVSDITQTGATINWTAAGGSSGYDLIIDQSSADPTSVVTIVLAPPYIATGLLSGTTYYAHVRDSCGPGNVSAWITVPFTTLTPCDSVVGITASAISSGSANISWTTIAGTTGYEVVVSTSSTNPPTGTVTGVGTNSYHATGLTDTTIYYVFVRDSCGPNNFSDWDTLSFTTLSLGVANVSNNQFDMIVYPNPAKEIVTLKVYGHMGANAKASITDVTGREISKQNMVTDKADFNIAGLASGIYLIRYEDDDHTQVIKVNKQ